jgi:hypothetical protein
MALNANAIIDKTFFEQMWNGEELSVDYIENYINAISSAFESFCNRPIIERSYTFEESEENLTNKIYYEPDYTILDAPIKDTLWLATYPVSEVSFLSISDTEISESTDFTADEGYILYKKGGKIIYSPGYDYPYRMNVKVKWKGGYPEDSMEISHIKFLCFSAMKDMINAPQNMTYESEKIGQYSYKTIPTYFLKSLKGLSPLVFSGLAKYRREAIG